MADSNEGDVHSETQWIQAWRYRVRELRSKVTAEIGDDLHWNLDAEEWNQLNRALEDLLIQDLALAEKVIDRVARPGATDVEKDEPRTHMMQWFRQELINPTGADLAAEAHDVSEATPDAFWHLYKWKLLQWLADYMTPSTPSSSQKER